MSHAVPVDWDVRTDDGTVVVELPRRLSLDDAAADRLRAALSDAVARRGVRRLRLVLDIEHPLSATLHDVIRDAARAAADHGVTDWRIVAEHEIKGVAVERAITGVDATVVSTEQLA